MFLGKFLYPNKKYLNESHPEYTISSNVNTVDEDGGIVIFDISSNVRKEGQSIDFLITEDSATDNIYDVRESMIGDFYSNISGWETQVDTYSDVTWQKLNGNGSMRMTSGHSDYVYVKKIISVRNGNNKIRINIPRIKIGSVYTDFGKNSKIMIQILKDGVSVEPSGGFVKILDYPNIISEGYENSIYDEDHYYSGYIDHEFTVDDLDSTYEFRIGLYEASSNYLHVYIDSIEDMYASFTVNSDGKSGTITPLATDGSTGLSVKLKTDSAVYNGNSFNVTFSQNGSKFKLDTDSDFTSDSITKTININEFSPLDYKVTSDVVQTIEGGSEINVTIEATNLSDIINVSRTLNLSVDGDRVSIPPTVDITTISAGEHSGSFVIDVITPDDNIIYPDEVNITITDPINSSSTFLVNPDSENEAPVVGTGTLTVTVIDNDVPEYTVSSNVNTVDEDGGVVVFDISSNVRKEGKSIGFSIIETVGVDNIESVHGESFYDDFSSDISRWEVTLQSNWNWVSETYCNVVYDNSHNGTMRMDSRAQRWSYTETLINHDNSETQTNKVRINIPHINTSNSKIYVSIVKDDTVIENTGYFNLLDTISSDFGVITANGDGTYSGYLEIDFTYDVDPNSEYKLRIGHTQINYNGYGLSAWDHVYIGDVNIYNVNQNLGKSGTITPSAVDGHAALTIKMKTDSIVSDRFDITFSETGSEFKLDTDSDFTSDSITKTINISDNDTPEYTISSNVNTVDEDGGVVVFDISSNVRKEGQSIGFEITEDSATDNIESVSEPYLYDDFTGDHLRSIRYVDAWNFYNIENAGGEYNAYGGGTMRLWSRHNHHTTTWPWSSPSWINHTSNQTSTNRIRAFFERIDSNSRISIYVATTTTLDNPSNPSAWDNYTLLTTTGNLYIGTSSTPGLTQVSGQSYYSGYIDLEYDFDGDLDKTYSVRFDFNSPNSSDIHNAYIKRVLVYNSSQGNQGKLGTITPSAVDGSSELVVTMKTDSVVSDGNTFDITFSETGSEFKLDTDSDFTSDSITKTISINEQTPIE